MTSKAADYLLAKGKGTEEQREKALWAMVQELRTEGFDARKPFEGIWTVSIAFFAGQQYTFFEGNSQRLFEVERVKGKIRTTDNKIQPNVMRQISDLVKNDPQVSVVPATTDQDDIKAARVGDKALRAWWRSAGMKGKVRRLATWLYTTGNAFLGDRWDEHSGPETFDEESGKVLYEGDVQGDVWSPFEVLIPYEAMGISELSESPWVIQVKRRGLGWFEENYGERGLRVKEESLAQTGLSIEDLLAGGSRAKAKMQGALETRLKIRPSRKYPKGLYVVAANGVILEEKEWPFDDFALEHFKDVEIPGIFWGKATMEQSIPTQKSWNRNVSSIEEFNRLMAKGKWLTPKAAKMEVSPDDTHGEVISYNPVMGHKPEHLSLKGLPPTVGMSLEINQASFQDNFSRHEVTRGTNKSDIRSGEMVGLLLEQDAQGRIPSHLLFEESLERFMRRVLRRIKEGYKGERILQLVGKEGEIEVFAFKGSQLRECSDVMVKKQSSMPESRAAKQEQIMGRFESGLYGDQTDPEVRRQVMNMLEDAVVKDIYSDDRMDETVARWENPLLVNLELKSVVPINDYDNHGLHVIEHNRFRKGMEYQRLKEQDPGSFQLIEQRFMTHLLMHQSFLDQARERMMQEAMAMKGGGVGG